MTTPQNSPRILALVAWVIQLVLAHLWFKRFRFRPLEWVWRSLTLKPGG